MNQSYSNPLLSALDAGLNANLSKSQWQLYAALVRQTLGYGKTSDDLTMNRLHKLTHLRQDHAKQALLALAEHNLITVDKGYYGFLITLQNIAQSTHYPTLLPDRADHNSNNAALCTLCTHNCPKFREASPDLGQTLPNKSPHPPQFRSELTNFRVNITPNLGTYIGKLNNKKPTHSTGVSDYVSQKPKLPISDYCKSIFAGLIKAISSELQSQALRITQALSLSQQQLTLKVWVAMINQNKVKSNAIALLGALVKAAKNNTLNTAILAKDGAPPTASSTTSAANPTPNPQQTQAIAKAQEAHSKRLMIEQHARLMGLSVVEYLQRFEGLSHDYQTSEVMA